MKKLTNKEREMLRDFLALSDNGVLSWPVARLADKLKVSYPTIKSYLDKFVSFGLAINCGDKASTKVNRYVFNVEACQQWVNDSKEKNTVAIRVIENNYMNFPVTKTCKHCTSVLELLHKEAVRLTSFDDNKMIYEWICPCCGKSNILL